MSDYTRVLKGLRHCINLDGLEPNDTRIRCHGCPYFTEPTRCGGILMRDAAAAIEDLQAEVQFYDALADEWKSAAENKERLLGLYRSEQAKHFYSAMDDNGRIITNPCACLNIPVLPDSSEIPNS